MTTLDTPKLYPSSRGVSRFNAWFFDAFDWLIDLSLRRFKKQIYVDLPQSLVEIGPGVGANFRYYRPGTHVVAIEPNPEMHQRLVRRAERFGIDLDLREGLAEETGLGSDAFEAVISNLVLCTVTDPKAAVEEAKRILTPGGRLIILEHVHGRGRLLRLIQRIVKRPWRWLFEGCELDRDTDDLVEAAGYSRTNLTTKPVLTVFVPINALTFGQAIK